MTEISSETPDWTRERPDKFWEPSKKLLRTLRDHERLQGPGAIRKFRRALVVLRHRFWTVITGAEIHLGSSIGGGLAVPHPNGVIVHPKAVIGPNCLLMQQTTLGVGGPKPGAPNLAGHVDVGAGAKILGGVRIGAHAKIGANAVVLQDVPPGATAVGVPARIIEKTP